MTAYSTYIQVSNGLQIIIIITKHEKKNRTKKKTLNFGQQCGNLKSNTTITNHNQKAKSKQHQTKIVTPQTHTMSVMVLLLLLFLVLFDTSDYVRNI